MKKTVENLKKALSGEAQACIRYFAFSFKADEEGYPGVARLFRAASMSEKIHAQSHQCALKSEEHVVEGLNSSNKRAESIDRLLASKAVKGTLENLQTAIDGETFEFKTMYPAMIQAAVAEKQLEARHSLEYAMSIEMIHTKLFKKALANPENNSVERYYICPVCGHTVESEAPIKCPYCGVANEKFYSVL